MPRISRKLALLTIATAIVAIAWLCSPAPAAEQASDQTDSPDVKTNELAELPNWPLGLKIPHEWTEGWKRRDRMKKSEKAHILIWTPPKAKRIRAVFLIPQNSDSKHVGEHGPLREVAKKHEIAIVYLRNFDGAIIERSDPPGKATEMFDKVLGLMAKETGIEEFKHAPWITFGKSSRGRFPFRTTWWFPDRVIASISYHGETPSWPMEKWSKVKNESVMHVAINGQEEWSGTWYRHVRPNMLNYHANTNWLTHQVVLHGVGHGDYADMHGSKGWGKPVPEGKISCLRVWDYIAMYTDKAMELRVPKDTYATDKPVKLKQIDPNSGYLVHPRAPEELLGMKWMAFRHKDGKYQVIPWPQEKHPVLDSEQGNVDKKLLIRHVEDVPADEREKLFWIPDRELTKAWLDLHNVEDVEGVLPPPRKDEEARKHADKDGKSKK